jgi:hypothetical protein
MTSTLQASNISVPAVIASYTFNDNGQFVFINTFLGVMEVRPSVTTEDDALTNNAYFELNFTLAASCTSLTLDQLKFQVVKGGPSTPRGWVVKAKVSATTVQLGNATISTEYPTYTDVSLAIPSTLGLATTCNGESISFLIYSYVTGSGEYVAFKNFELTGSGGF